MQTVYCATNIDYPYCVKIGWSKKEHPGSRVKSLYSAGVLSPWELRFYIATPNGKLAESIAHKKLSHCRMRENKEFFMCSVDVAKNILTNTLLDILGFPEVLSKKEEKVVLKRKRADNINLFNIGLSYGDVLYFCKDSKIICTVKSENTVYFRGEELTLTEAVRKTGIIRQKEIQGPKYWLYDNKSLVQIRKEKELFT